MSLQAARAACEEAAKAWQLAQNTSKAIGDNQVALVNAIREVGIALHLAAGKQLTFTASGMHLFTSKLKPFLPASLGLNEAKACVTVANRMPKPVASLEELRRWQDAMQLSLQITGIEHKKERQVQSAAARSFFAEFLREAHKLGKAFEAMCAEDPPDRWDSATLDDLMEAAEPLRKIMKAVETARMRGGA